MLWFNFILGLILNFPLFLGMVMHDNEFLTEEKNLNQGQN